MDGLKLGMVRPNIENRTLCSRKEEKMKKILTIVVVLALCVNSFGEVLVYKVSGHTSGFTVGPSLQPNTAKKFSSGIKGYVVTNINTSTLNSVAADANNRPAFIDIANKSFVTLSSTTPHVTNASFDLTVSGDQYSQRFSVLTNGGKATKKVIVLPQFNFRYFTSSPKLDVQFSNSLMDGELKLVDIGNPTKVALPRSIKGDAFFFVTTDVGGAQESVGRVSFKVDSKFTKLANDRAIHLTVAQTVDQIEQELIDSGHNEMTPEEFFGQ